MDPNHAESAHYLPKAAERLEMLKKAGGIDQRYHYHHSYDRELSLLSLANGYKNIVLNVKCHHISGLTANRSEYQEWISKHVKENKGDVSADKWTHDHNSELFRDKWHGVLPVYVNDDFTFRTKGSWDFKGDEITRWSEDD